MVVGSFSPAASEPGARAPALVAALAFTEGARGGWLASDLAAWVREHVAGRGFLRVRRGAACVALEEPGYGRIVVPLAVSGPVARQRTDPDATTIVRGARDRVVASLGGMLRSPPDDRFLHGAIYTGRVERLRRGRESGWTPALDDGGALSQWVLALFATDALTSRELYETDLCVCERCGAIGFGWRTRSRSRCPAHDGPTESNVRGSTARGLG